MLLLVINLVYMEYQYMLKHEGCPRKNVTLEISQIFFFPNTFYAFLHILSLAYCHHIQEEKFNITQYKN